MENQSTIAIESTIELMDSYNLFENLNKREIERIKSALKSIAIAGYLDAKNTLNNTTLEINF
jgi:hypothetical protein